MVSESKHLDFLFFAIANPGFQRRFYQESGHDLEKLMPTSPIEQMIDEATGFDARKKEIIIKFIDWVTVNFWGVKDD